MNVPEDRLGRLQWAGLGLGGLGLFLCLLALLFFDRVQALQSYLYSFLFWLGLALGCLAILLLHRLTGGAWGAVIGRILEAGATTLPLMALLFLPLLLGLSDLYAWADAARVAESPLLQHKRPYLNVQFFLGRAIVYFLTWMVAAVLLLRRPMTPESEREAGHRRLFALGLILYVLTMTFASFDWLMSLEPEWFSTIYGLLIIAGQVLGALALGIAGLLWLHDRQAEPLVAPRVLNDLGNLLLAFVLSWTYLALSQYMIIWYGNLPEETTWYIHRSRGGWQWLALAIVGFHFALPFVVLLSRRAKRTGRILASVAALILVSRLLDTFWLVMPAFYESNLHVHWLDLAALLGVGGLWVTLFARTLRGRPLIPTGDPQLEEVLDRG